MSSAARMVCHIKKWLSRGGSDDNADSMSSSRRESCEYCGYTASTDDADYRSRSYSDCCTAAAVSHRSTCTAARNRSSSVNSSYVVRFHGPTSSRTTAPCRGGSVSWSKYARIDDIDEDADFRPPPSYGEEPVCCCDMCAAFIELRPAQPPPYQDAELHRRTAAESAMDDVRLKNTAVNDTVSEDVFLESNAVQVSMTSSSTTVCMSVDELIMPTVTSRKEVPPRLRSETSLNPPPKVELDSSSMPASTQSLPPSIPISLDGEEGYAESQRRLLLAQRRLQASVPPPTTTRSNVERSTRTACTFVPPPNKTICHVW